MKSLYILFFISMISASVARGEGMENLEKNLKTHHTTYWSLIKDLVQSAPSVLGLIDELAECGTKFISFAGGEPLLRGDIGEIADYCRSKGMQVVIHSNGLLLKDEIKKVKNVHEIKLSLDGPKEINDAVRGKGSYDKVIEALEVCKNEGIYVNISTVISKNNYLHVSYMLDFAKEYQVGVYFHPADQNHSGDSSKHIPNRCDPEEFKVAVNLLIDEKRKGHKFISNSLAGLKHLSCWPKPKKIFCFLELIGCVIRSDGSIFVCDNFLNYQEYAIPAVSNFKKSFNRLKLPHSCGQCWCGPIVDFNLMGSFNLENLIGIWKRYNKKY